VRIDVLKRFGFYSTESNGHLSEYLPWYRKRPEEIMDWISLDEWIHGETGGYLRYTTENRNWFEEDFPKFLDEAGKPLTGPKRTDEHASHILEALETGRTYRGHFNVRTAGSSATCPRIASSKAPASSTGSGSTWSKGSRCPPPARRPAWLGERAADERQAAVTGDVELLKQAVLHDPLVGAICTPDEVWQMVDEMLVAQAKWLPQYAHAIPAAVERLKSPRSRPGIGQGRHGSTCGRSPNCARPGPPRPPARATALAPRS
jgi:alpha-galactosidase